MADNTALVNSIIEHNTAQDGRIQHVEDMSLANESKFNTLERKVDVNDRITLETQAKQAVLEDQFNELIEGGTVTIAEVIEARGSDVNLKTRLDKSDDKITDLTGDIDTVKSSRFDSLESALQFAYANKKTLIIDKQYVVSNMLTVPKGVKIKATENGVITRGFLDKEKPCLLLLTGYNEIDGLKVNGNAKNYVIDGTDFIYFAEILCKSDNDTGHNKITNCSFIDSVGSHLCSKDGNFEVYNCEFGEYLDHAIYVGATNTDNATSKNITVSNCKFNAPVSTRECFKARNGVYNLKVENNSFNLPNANFMTLDIGDGGKPNRDNENVTLRDCNGFCTTFVSSSQTSNIDSTLKSIKNLTIDSCNVVTSSVCFQFGWLPTSNNTFGTCFENVKIINSTFNVPYLILSNGKVGKGIKDVIIDNCQITYSYDYLIDFVGDNLNYNLTNSTIISTLPNQKYARLFELTQKKYFDLGIRPTLESYIYIENNDTVGVHRLINESTSAKGATDWIYEIHARNNNLTSLVDDVVLFNASGMNATSNIPSKLCYNVNNTFNGNELISYPSKYVRSQTPYNRGTFTPVFVSDGATFTYTKQTGNYVIANGVAILSFDLRIATKTVTTNTALKIGGLPNLSYLQSHITNIVNTVNLSSSVATHIFVGKKDDNTQYLHITKAVNSDLLYVNDVGGTFIIQGSITLPLN